MSIIDSLIYNRTKADVDRWEELKAKGFKAMTAEEQAEWMAAMKGAYNYTNLNRVGQAIAYIASVLNGYGYDIAVSPKTDWIEKDIPTLEQLNAYLANVSIVRAALATLPTTPDVPADMDALTVEEANAIEKILVDLDTQLNRMATTFIPCGEAFCGGDKL